MMIVGPVLPHNTVSRSSPSATAFATTHDMDGGPNGRQFCSHPVQPLWKSRASASSTFGSMSPWYAPTCQCRVEAASPCHLCILSTAAKRGQLRLALLNLML